MDSGYRHWTTGVVAFLFMVILVPYVATFYLPQLWWSDTSFSLVTHVMIPVLFVSTITYFFINARWGHHALTLAVVFLLGVSAEANDGKAVVLYGLILLLLAATVLHLSRRSRLARPLINLR